MAKNRIFSIFSRGENKNDRGVTKQQAAFDGKYNFKNFFKFLKNNFGNLTQLNLIFVLCNFTIILLFFAMTGYFNYTVPTPQNIIYPHLISALGNESEIVMQSYLGAFGVGTTISVASTTTKALMYSNYLLFITFGLSNIGASFVLRAMLRRKHSYIAHDFFRAIKKNIKQGIILGVLDVGVLYLLVYDLIVFNANKGNSFLYQIFFYCIILFALIYAIMRFYMYLMLITFDLPLRKIYKNALLFTVLGIKRNLAAVAGLAVFIFASVMIYLYLPTVGILLPMVFSFATGMFLCAYCAWPIIDQYMIKPYYADKPTPDEEEEALRAQEAVFKDRG